MTSKSNIDPATVQGFGQEWTAFTQQPLSDQERRQAFSQYFSLIDWTNKPARALDFGCGSGRWAALVAPFVGELVAADASPLALQVARTNASAPNISFVECTPDSLPFPDNHFNLIFSLGVLHHLPDTTAAIHSLGRKLAPGGTFLLYLYYAFDNRPTWFRALWKLSDLFRRAISRLPFPLRYLASQLIAAIVYFPLARFAKYFPVPDAWPLKVYGTSSFYTMRTDALDRFGTRLEHRFSRSEIAGMLTNAGLTQIRFSPFAPYWVCVAKKILV